MRLRFNPSDKLQNAATTQLFDDGKFLIKFIKFLVYTRMCTVLRRIGWTRQQPINQYTTQPNQYTTQAPTWSPSTTYYNGYGWIKELLENK